MYADDILIDQLAHHILGVDLNDNECRKHHPLHAGQLPSHQGHQVTELKETSNYCRHLGPIAPHPLHRGRASATDSVYILGASTDLRWEERKDQDKGRQKNICGTCLCSVQSICMLMAGNGVCSAVRSIDCGESKGQCRKNLVTASLIIKEGAPA